MDPKEALRALLALARTVLADEDKYDEQTVELAERVTNLDDWMVRGGYSPWLTFPGVEGRGRADREWLLK